MSTISLIADIFSVAQSVTTLLTINPTLLNKIFILLTSLTKNWKGIIFPVAHFAIVCLSLQWSRLQFEIKNKKIVLLFLDLCFFIVYFFLFLWLYYKLFKENIRLKFIIRKHHYFFVFLRETSVNIQKTEKIKCIII